MKTKLTYTAGLVALSALCGCSVLRVNNHKPNGDSTHVTAYVPAWPWQDSAKVIERLNVSSRTNSFTGSVRGYSETETTTTNAVDLISSVVGAAVSAAIKATVKP